MESKDEGEQHLATHHQVSLAQRSLTVVWDNFLKIK